MITLLPTPSCPPALSPQQYAAPSALKPHVCVPPELSDANGDFSNPVVIGTLNTASNSGSIACEIPAGTPSGIGYKIRVTNASPYYAPLEAGIVIDLSTAAL